MNENVEIIAQGSRELLLKDLCARLPYGVKYLTYLGDTFTLKDLTLSHTSTRYYIDDNAFSLSQIKPYLRPMSSMTEEESRIYDSHRRQIVDSGGNLLTESITAYNEFLISHHFDYRGLIPMGLAIEAPEGMYK